MGTKRSKHNKGRKPLYKDFNAAQARALKRFGPNLSPEQQANVLLYGWPNAIEPGDEREVWTVLGGGRPRATSFLYKEPDKKFHYQKEKPKCEQCGRERSWSSARLCGECYRGNALKSFHERSDGLEAALALVSNTGFEGLLFDVTKGGSQGNIHHQLVSLEPDFAPELIEAIYKEEISQGKPFVFCSPPENRAAKPLYHSPEDIRATKAAKRMFNQKPQSKTIKQGKKMGNWMRGTQSGLKIRKAA